MCCDSDAPGSFLVATLLFLEGPVLKQAGTTQQNAPTRERHEANGDGGDDAAGDGDE